jgi:hypothetical protein
VSRARKNNFGNHEALCYLIIAKEAIADERKGTFMVVKLSVPRAALGRGRSVEFAAIGMLSPD